ncbi:MAG: hypothetical protein QOD99_1591 [Chthoniobacter sp.]|jgi:exopolysaccharide biosynthesis protein|nr:hypothetical protein [Chthoniobacter sp.]
MRFGQAGKRFGRCAVVLLLLAAGNNTGLAADGSGWTVIEKHDESPPGAAAHSLQSVTKTLQAASTSNRVRLRMIKVDFHAFDVRVIDNPRGDESLAEAMTRAGASAGINGGYFQPDRTPLGLEISGGKLIHRSERARLLSGILICSGHSVRLLRVGEFTPSKTISEALQAGPFLVDRSASVPGLNAIRAARRTAVISTAGGAQWLVVSEPVTLAEFAQILITPNLAGADGVERALNLDGGSSTGMWIRDRDTSDLGNPDTNVRNYLAIVPR